MNVKWIGCLLIGAFLVTGCSQTDGQKASSLDRQEVAYGLLGPGPLNYGEIKKAPKYRYEGEINTSTSFKTMNRDRRTLGDDQELIHHIIHNRFGLDSGMVILAGSNAFVNVTFPKDLSKAERKEKLDQLNKAFMSEIPRYKVHVREK
ncbi:hypothetical protein GN156_06445 [bacterium LRH843]|nr:hypothetical protein [bacterium LRH843]